MSEDTTLPTLRATSASPILPVRDVRAALERFERLGFSVSPYSEGSDGDPIYGFVGYGPGEIHVASVSDLDPRTTTSACYLYVEDADAVYAAWSDAGVEGTLHPPVDTAYGLREMAYVDPDGNLIRVGSSMDAPT